MTAFFKLVDFYWKIKRSPVDFSEWKRFNLLSLTFCVVYSSCTITCTSILIMLPFLGTFESDTYIYIQYIFLSLCAQNLLAAPSNDSSRTFPFPICFEVPQMYKSPLYEILYSVQVIIHYSLFQRMKINDRCYVSTFKYQLTINISTKRFW